jgi:hypothetical protein
MDVDQSRCNNQTIDVHSSLGGVWFEQADRRNNTMPNTNIRDVIYATAWVDDVPPTEKQTATHRHARPEKNRLAVQSGPGDGAAAERLVMVCATNSLVTGVDQSIGVSSGHRQKPCHF